MKVKLLESAFKLDDRIIVPFSDDNTDYQRVIEWIKSGNLPEGADIIEPDYVALRTGPDGYAPIADQLDMQFKNDGSWEAHVQAVKDKFPKTITGGTTIAPLPQWVLDLVQ